MSHAAKKSGQKPKSSKALKNEFERVVSELKKESRAFQTPSSQKLIFGAASAWAAFAPLYLYVSGIFDVNFMENIILFLIGPIVAVAVLYYIYDLSASQSRYKLLLNRDAEVDKKKEALVNQSAYHAIFSVNASYLVVFLFSIGYLLPLYQLSHPISFSVASIFAALSTGGLVVAKVL